MCARSLKSPARVVAIGYGGGASTARANTGPKNLFALLWRSLLAGVGGAGSLRSNTTFLPSCPLWRMPELGLSWWTSCGVLGLAYSLSSSILTRC